MPLAHEVRYGLSLPTERVRLSLGRAFTSAGINTSSWLSWTADNVGMVCGANRVGVTGTGLVICSAARSSTTRSGHPSVSTKPEAVQIAKAET